MGNPRVLVVALVLAALPAVASAQSAKDKQKAGELVKQAIAKSQAGEHAAAIDLYLEAYKIIPQPVLLSNVGSAYQASDKPVEALSYFCKYISADPLGSNVGYATAQAKVLYIKLGGIDTVQDADVCKPIVKKPEDKPIVDVKPSVDTTPNVDGDRAKVSPLRWVGVGVAVLGAGVFGLGVFYGLEAKSISDDITNHPMDQPWDRDIAQQEADGASYEKKQIYFMIGGGIALAAGVTLFFLSPRKAQAESTDMAVRFTPVASPDSFGLAAAGRF